MALPSMFNNLANRIKEAQDSRVLQADVLGQDLSAQVAGGIIIAVTGLLILFYLYEFWHDRCDWEVPYVQIVTLVRYILSTFTTVQFQFIYLSGGVVLPLGRYLLWLLIWPVILIEYYQIMGTYGPKLDFANLNTAAVKLLVVIVFGTLSAANTDVKKWVLFAGVFCVTLWLFYQIQKQYFLAAPFFPKEAIRYVAILTVLVCFSWSLYPIFFVIGIPGLNLIGFEADVVANAFVDFMASNVVGFYAWFTRWSVLEPMLRRENRTSRKISPFSQAAREQEARRRKVARKENSVRIVAIENNVAYQRLIQYLMLDAGVDVAVTASIEDATEIIRRGHQDDYDAVIIDLGYLGVKISEIGQFREEFSKHPWHMPLLGFTFQDTGLGTEFQEKMSNLCDGLLMTPLDEFKTTESIAHWKKAANLWRELALTSNNPKFRNRPLADGQGHMPFSGGKPEGNAGKALGLLDIPSVQETSSFAVQPASRATTTPQPLPSPALSPIRPRTFTEVQNEVPRGVESDLTHSPR